MKTKRNIRVYAVLTILVMLIATTGSACGKQQTTLGDTEQNIPATGVSATDPSATDAAEDGTQNTDSAITVPDVTYEAEDGSFTGSVSAKEGGKNYSNEAYVEGFENEGDSCAITINITTAGFYDLYFATSGIGGEKANDVYVDGTNTASISSKKDSISFSVAERIYFEEGSHIISLVKSWGWIKFDYMTVKQSKELDTSIYQVSADLVNPNAADCAKRLMSYMTDIYGEYFLSGQYCDTGMYGDEIKAIWKTTGGKFPAVLGLDLIEASSSRIANGSVSKAVDYALEFNEKGGIVTMCWHWNAPEKYLTGTWYRGFYTEETNIDLAKIMNGEDEEGYQLLLDDIKVIAGELQKLEDADVRALWRPLHEASGGWFWWGASGAEAYKKLWVLLYDTLTNEYELDNLIWLWNGQDASWYPGDEYVDIIGEDIYPGEHVYTSQIGKYMEAVNYTSPAKMVVLSENGCLFDPDLAIRDGAMWGFFATWQGDFVVDTGLVIKLSEKYTEESMLLKVYDHEKVITLDELPDLTSYEIRQ